MRRLFLLTAALGALGAPAAALAAHAPRHARTAVHHAPRHAADQPSGTFFIRGGGYGHGIGMSQYGAYGYALHGADYQAILAHYYSGTSLGQVDPNQTVRVLLHSGSASFSGATGVASGTTVLSGAPTTTTAPSPPKPSSGSSGGTSSGGTSSGGTSSGASSGSGGASIAAARHLNPDLVYTVKAQADGTLVLLDPKGKKVGRYQAPLAVTGPGPLTVPGLGSYRGALEFRPDGHGVQTVNAVGLDDYVRGVIGIEESASWPAQALEAQAVAARTYAITTSVTGNGYTLYSDTRSQMYGGVGAEAPSTDAAVAATRGQVVTYQGQPVVTYFSSSSGGYTASIQDAWPGATPEPWLTAVPDPYDSAGANPYHHWSYTMSLSQAASHLGSVVKGSLIGVRITKHGDSPRVLEAQVVGSSGTTTVSGEQLQSAFSLPTTLASFTTIIDLPGPAPTHGKKLGSLPTNFLAKLVSSLGHIAGAPLGLHGVVFPARSGDTIAVQQLGSHGWSDVHHVRLGAGGSYSLSLSAAGSYRVVYQGLDGPAVTVG